MFYCYSFFCVLSHKSTLGDLYVALINEWMNVSHKNWSGHVLSPHKLQESNNYVWAFFFIRADYSCAGSLSVFILYFLASFILFIYLHLVTTTVCDGCNRPEIRSCLCLTGSRFRDFHCSSSSSSHLWYIWESPSPGKPQKQKKKKLTSERSWKFLLFSSCFPIETWHPRQLVTTCLETKEEKKKKTPKQDFEKLNPVFACMVPLS